MAEFINREAFKKSAEERYCKPCEAEGKDHNGCWCRACWVDDMLDEVECFQPSDVAPVVRCKDCKYRYSDSWCEYVDDDNFYCARGERKEGADNEP